MIMGIRVRVNKELIGVGPGRNKRALYVNLIRVLACLLYTSDAADE